MKTIDQIRAARRVSVPILAVQTPDQAATVAAVVEGINGGAPKVQWDFVRGFRPLNDEGAAALAGCGDDAEDATANPTGAVSVANKLPEGTMVFIHNANRYLDDAGFIQAVGNIRDQFKQDRRTLILLGPSVTLPVELAGDVIVLDEELPSAVDAETIIRDLHEAGGIEVDEQALPKAVAAAAGITSRFAVEQLAALSMTKNGIDTECLWGHNCKQITTTPGLSVFRGGATFSTLTGLEPVKKEIIDRGNGRMGCNVVVWIDEGGDQLGGMNDMTGITKDYHGHLIQFMEDRRARGFLHYGHPGTGKSQICKCAGAELGVPTIRIDLGAMMGSLVGESQQHLRQAIRVIDAVSGGKMLVMLTTNDMSGLSPQFQARFTSGIFFYDLLSKAERDGAWNIHRAKYDLLDDVSWETVDDAGWVGRDIRDCCESAWDKRCTIAEAAKRIVPVAMSCPLDIEKRQEQANGKYLDASKDGIYRRTITRESAVRHVKARKMDV
jgi:hypothetical protein